MTKGIKWLGVLYVTWLLIIFFSPSQILLSPKSYYMMVGFSLIISRMCINIQLAHVAKMTDNDWSEWYPPFLIICYVWLFNTLFFVVFKTELANEILLGYATFAFGIVTFVYSAICNVLQVKDVLKIHVFDLNYVRPVVYEEDKQTK